MLFCTIYERIQMNANVNLKDVGQSAMRAQVATFAGWPMPSQFMRRQAPKIISVSCIKCKEFGVFLGACRLPNCDGMGHPANVATCARMALCPISFQIHNSIHLNSFIYCAKEHFLCFCFKYNAKTYAICTEFHIN